MRTKGVLVLRDWEFALRDGTLEEAVGGEGFAWAAVTVPHDWAIKGEFRKENDLQVTNIVENGESKAYEHYGRTGALPHVGKAWYRRRLDVPASAAGRSFVLAFDGIMSHSTVYVNGRNVGGRPFGYASFELDVTDVIVPGGENWVYVHVDNPPSSSRWYPGAGMYREARFLMLDPAHFETFGVWLRTPFFDPATGNAVLRVETHVSAPFKDGLRLEVQVVGPGVRGDTASVFGGWLEMKLAGVAAWSPAAPNLYKVFVRLVRDGAVLDEEVVRYGFRNIVMDADGMTINGRPFRMNGICQHHDLGPVGAAFLPSAARRQLELLKSVGCNAIRTSHNPPAPQLLDLCDELGFVVMDEAFDEWKLGKVDNGYHILFDEWHERDLADFIRRDRNHPSVAFWSTGNEIHEIFDPDGWKVARHLQDICHREDPDRKATAGMNISWQYIANGFVGVLDMAGYNYKPVEYAGYKKLYPHLPQFGSETSSTTSTRGYYDFPVVPSNGKRENGMCSSYDLEHPAWASIPDEEFKGQDECPTIMGEFVWTGLDYLGEPTPYDWLWPSHSSYFGIFDLAGLRKDRAWLYEARWTRRNVLHLLPHWNWAGREGQVTPVHAYTNADHVELFVNGVSQGVRQPRYCRCRWDEVVYAPGEVVAVGYDAAGTEISRDRRVTAGEPCALALESSRNVLLADPDGLGFVTVAIHDKDGNLCPLADNEISFKVEGEGGLEAVANGDPRCLTPFGSDKMAAFFGMCVAVVRSNGKIGEIKLTAKAKGLPEATLVFEVR